MFRLLLTSGVLLICSICAASGLGAVESSNPRVLQEVFSRAVACADPTSKPVLRDRTTIVRYFPSSADALSEGIGSDLARFLVSGDTLSQAVQDDGVDVIDVVVLGGYKRDPRLLFLLLQRTLSVTAEPPRRVRDGALSDEQLRQLVAARRPWFVEGWSQQIAWVAATPEEAAQLFHLDQAAPSGATALLIDDKGIARVLDGAVAVSTVLPAKDYPNVVEEWQKFVTERMRDSTDEAGSLADDSKKLTESVARFASVLGGVPLSTDDMVIRFWTEAFGGSRGFSEKKRLQLQTEHGDLLRPLLQAARGDPVIEAQVVWMMLGVSIEQFRELVDDLEQRNAKRERNTSYVLLALRSTVAKRIEGIRPSAERDDWKLLLRRIDELYDASDRKPIFDDEMSELRRRKR